jgi:hypothetical protein
MWAGLIGASEKEGFCVASGGEDFGCGIASGEEDFRIAFNEEEGLKMAVSLMMASLDVVAASDEEEGFVMGAATKAGLFCASVEDLVLPMMEKAKAGAATMAGFGMGAPAKAGLEFFASSEEEGFAEVAKMEGEAATSIGHCHQQLIYGCGCCGCCSCECGC